MATILEHLIGPRVPAEEIRAHRLRYLTPTFLFMLARVLLLVSIFLPYWHMELEAPQYPLTPLLAVPPSSVSCTVIVAVPC